jgi:hypothetical protein
MRYYFGAVAYFSYPVSTANKKTAGKLARSVAVGICQKKDKSPALTERFACFFFLLHIHEISYVSLRIDK